MSFDAGDTNLYRYVGNNPMTYTDPTGMCGESSWFGVASIGSDWNSDFSLAAGPSNVRTDSYDIGLSQAIQDANLGRRFTKGWSHTIGWWASKLPNFKALQNMDTFYNHRTSAQQQEVLKYVVSPAVEAYSGMSNGAAKVWGWTKDGAMSMVDGVSYFGSQYLDSLVTGRQLDTIDARAGWFFYGMKERANDVLYSLDYASRAVTNEIGVFFNDPFSYTLKASETAETWVNNAMDKPYYTFVAPLKSAGVNIGKSFLNFPNQLGATLESLKQPEGFRHLGRFGFDGFMMAAPLEKIVGLSRSVGYLDDLTRYEMTVPNSTRAVMNLERISPKAANDPFLKKGWSAPYPKSPSVRMFSTGKEMKFVRVHGIGNQQGAFLVRAKEIAGMNAKQIQQHLALPQTPTHISDVIVPKNIRMQMGKVAPQPQFGAPTTSGVQYQLLDKIPHSAYRNMRKLP